MKRNKSGISLIVLVITIIVMIILAAAVVIALDNSGIINKANEAVDASNLKQVQHLANLIWAEAYLEDDINNEDITDAYIKEELGKQGINTDNYTITVEDNGVTVLAKGGSSGTDISSATYSIGDEVKIGNESFYVIRECSATDTTVLLLAKEGISTTELVQTSSADTTTYSSAINLASNYAKKIDENATGRLITRSEAESLKDSYSNLLFINGLDYYCDKGDNYYIMAVLSTPGAHYMAKGIVAMFTEDGHDASQCGNYENCNCNYFFKVRPIVEISKSIVSQ